MIKKKSILLVLFSLILVSALFLCACGSNGSGDEDKDLTLEEYAAGDEDMQESISSAAEGSNVVIDIKGNDIIYSFDLSAMEGYTEDIAKNEEIVKALQSSLDSAGPTFGGIAKNVQETTQIEGIRTIVNYSWKDEVLVTKTFTADDAEDEEAKDSKNTDSEESESESEGSESE